MQIPKKLQALGIGSWFELFGKLGIALAAVGLIGTVLEGYFELMVPVGIVLAFLPMLVMLPTILLMAIWLVLTSPIRGWCLLRIWMIDRWPGLSDKNYNHFHRVIEALDRWPDFLFWWSRD